MNKRRSDLAIMRKLIVLIKPLTGVMLTGIVLGVLGFLCAIFLTILGGYGILKGIWSFLLCMGFPETVYLCRGASSLLLQAHGRSSLP